MAGGQWAPSHFAENHWADAHWVQVAIVPPAPDVQPLIPIGGWVGIEAIPSRARIYHPASDPLRVGAKLRGRMRYQPAIRRPGAARVGVSVALSARWRDESIIRSARRDDEELLELGIL